MASAFLFGEEPVVDSGELSDGSDIDCDDDGTGITETDNMYVGDEDDSFSEWARYFFTTDNDADDEAIFHDDWTTDRNKFSTTREFTYKLNGGCEGLSTAGWRPIDFFCLYWDMAFWTHLVDETNRYARDSRAAKWKDVTLDEMKCFIGTIFAMGALNLANMADYWRRTIPLLQTNFGQVMSRDRFFQLWRYLHLADNSRDTSSDRLYKVRWCIDTLNQKFFDIYKPHKAVTVDESMIGFKGRLGFRQYLPSKPVKWGIKMWALSESTTGYLHQFQIYTGKDEASSSDKGLAHRVVLDLTMPFRYKNIQVYMDNYFSSPVLFDELYRFGILAAGTVRPNRKGLPQALLPKNVKLQKHASMVAQNNELVCCLWVDTKPVMVLSNFHSPLENGSVKRRTGHTDQVNVSVPLMLRDYQKYMKGVDLTGQMIQYYAFERRSRKWWRKIFFRLMSATAYNAYIVARSLQPVDERIGWKTYKCFTESLLQDLTSHCTTKRAPSPTAAIAKTVVHDLDEIFGGKRRVCAVCSVQHTEGKRPSATKYGCVQCNVALHKKCLSSHIRMSII